jgi:hypothetical protein
MLDDNILLAIQSNQFVARFWSKVETLPDGCWLWSGQRSRYGYGIVAIPRRIAKNKYARANRVAWMIANGPIGSGLCVCHRCDNPPCCRPDHLFAATQIKNVADRDHKRRGRWLSGAQHPSARFTDSDVRTVLALSATLSQPAIARRFGVNRRTVGRLLLGQSRYLDS